MLYSSLIDYLSAFVDNEYCSFDSRQKEIFFSYIKQRRYSQAQYLLLVFLADNPCNVSFILLLASLYLFRKTSAPLKSLIARLARLMPDHSKLHWLQAEYALNNFNGGWLKEQPAEFWSGESQFQPLLLVHIRERLLAKDLAKAISLFSQLQDHQSLEARSLQSEILFQKGQNQQALEILYCLVQDCPESIALQEQFLAKIIDARNAQLILPAAREALSHHGEHWLLLPHVTTIKLHQRQPGLARRAILLNKVWNSIAPVPTNLANQVITYEQTGHADWLEFLHPALLISPKLTLDLHINLALQLASIESKNSEKQLQHLISALYSSPAYLQHKTAGSGVPKILTLGSRRLRVAWVTGDLAPHPVSRFLHGFFSGSSGNRSHDHLLVSVFDHGQESNAHWFTPLPDLQLVDVSREQDHHRVSAIRALQADVAIDLSGWTGGNFLAGFMARLAPVQVNYLGYFATTGLSEIDYWLGDRALFPEPMQEWHSETPWRLERPFLAWQPIDPLPEATAQLTEAPQGPICFGTFNHNRKLSDRTLRLWGRLLQAVPGSLLVLKANAKDDSATQELLRRRLLRAGLDPNRVQWLSLTGSCAEHLQQYRHIDIALDPLPNGGCTTTCEALWMGVPVITLAGRGYVSRMSTAVLQGVGLHDWVATSEDHYLQLAIAQAQNLQSLRSRRDHWRRQLQLSPLGDTKDLMQHLEAAFLSMYQQKLIAP
jgi:predicted O-linked N-acetylglucosamine transferase (SPINDLY family)